MKDMGTIRREMIALLSEAELDAMDLSRDLGIPEKEVYGHLSHIARTVSVRGRRLVIRPASCLKCGYVFEDRKRFTRPGRCPRCRGTRLERPAYSIR